jgi:hypothetical protein
MLSDRIWLQDSPEYKIKTANKILKKLVNNPTNGTSVFFVMIKTMII